MSENEKLSEELNELIAKCKKAGGHVYIVDKMQNRFALRLTESVNVFAFIPTAREVETAGRAQNVYAENSR
jgi:hypothetical protein